MSQDLIDVAQAQECLRQARDLTQRAASLLSEIGVDGKGNVEAGVDFKDEISLATSAGQICNGVVDRLRAKARELAVR